MRPTWLKILFCLVIYIGGRPLFGQIGLAFNPEKIAISTAVENLIKNSPEDIKAKNFMDNAQIKVFTQDDIGAWTSAGIFLQHFTQIESGGYSFKWSAEKRILFILAIDPKGAAKGIEALEAFLKKGNGYQKMKEYTFNPY